MVNFNAYQKYVCLFVFIQFLIISSIILIKQVSAQSDFMMFLGNTINDNEIDGVLGLEWKDVTSYDNLAINPNGNVNLWIKHDQTILYIAMQFQADLNTHGVPFSQIILNA